MLLSVGISLIILIPTIILHYSQHFTFNVSCKISKSLTSIRANKTYNVNVAKNHKCCKCHLCIPIDEDFNFFPIFFLYYMIFVLSICLVIIALEIINFFYTDDPFNIHNFSIHSPHNHSILELQTMKTADTHPISIYICDFIIIYGILIISIWSSFFSFYRYYTTFVSTKQFTLISTQNVTLRFSIFALVFAVMFMVEIHLYYWLWPIVVTLYCGFNWFCSWKFASILIKQFEFFISMEEDYVYSSNQDVLESVYFMKRASLLCCLLQTFSLSIFVITYDVDSVYYLPIFWSLSSVAFALNFIRNRTFLKFVFQSNTSKTKLTVNNTSNKPSRKQYTLSKQTPHNVDPNEEQNLATECIKTECINNKTDPAIVSISRKTTVIVDDMGSKQLKQLRSGTKSDVDVLMERERQTEEFSRRYKIPTESLSGYDWDNHSRRASRHKLKDGRSNSMPVNIDETVDTEDIDIDQVLRSFYILSKYGFCNVNLDTDT